MHWGESCTRELYYSFWNSKLVTLIIYLYAFKYKKLVEDRASLVEQMQLIDDE